MFQKIVFTLVVFSISFISNAQFLVHSNSIEVLDSLGNKLNHAWVGGLNSVQFSQIDLDLDGKKDLFTFDRSGHKIRTFRNNGTPNTIDYVYAPEFQSDFPKMHDWVLLRDYDCDGKEDIFTYSSGGFAVYKNTSTPGNLSFVKISDLVFSDYSKNSTPPQMANLYISSTDIPAIDDIDGDGDLDVVTFSIFGSYVEYHKNMSKELYGTCDSLTFKLKNNCWGFFSENFSNNSVTLSDTCPSNVVNPEKIIMGGNKHSGSTLLTLDLNNDGLRDLVLGDVSFKNMTSLINNGSVNNAYMISQDSVFPKNNTNTLPIDLQLFPAAFYLDINNDGNRDLIVSPGTPNGSENTKSCWLYTNSNITNQPTFNFSGNNFLQGEMMEHGEGSYPVFFDYNADGLMDLLVGNFIYYVDNAFPKSAIALYENIGTPSQPKFQLKTRDYAGIAKISLNTFSNMPTYGVCPTFGDVDGDGDQDMIVGDYNGKVHLFTNTAGAGNTANFILTQADYQGIDAGNYAKPQLFDISGDTLLDLVIGNQAGKIEYYKNIGTKTTPNFSLQTQNLGNVNVTKVGNVNGYSRPFFFKNGNQIELLCGSLSGQLFHYNNIDSSASSIYNVVDTSFYGINEGARASIVGADINSDGLTDYVIGNYSGGNSLYLESNVTNIKESGFTNYNLELITYPNPSNDKINIQFSNPYLIKFDIRLYDLQGKLVYSEKYNTNNIQIDVSNLSKGVYVLKVNSLEIPATAHDKIIKY